MLYNLKQTKKAEFTHFERNWMFNSPVSGVRVDGGSDKFGYNCTVADNVGWKIGRYMMKGDYHNVTGNLALEMYDPNAFQGLKVVHIRRKALDIKMNQNSIVRNNAAMFADGDKDLSCPKNKDGSPGASHPLAGIKSNNYYGNYSFSCGDEFDWSVVLDGTVIPGANASDFPKLLVDIDNYDFRPKSNTLLTSTGTQIGPYSSLYSNGDRYFIPGRREEIASHPIPKHNAQVDMREDVIFQPAYR